MEDEYRRVWTFRFVASGSIIILFGYILASAFAPFCPVGEPEWRLQYQRMTAMRLLILYALAGALLISLGLLLRLRLLERKYSGQDKEAFQGLYANG